MLLIDAHNEYADCFDDRAQVFGPDNLKLPFWLFNFDEMVQILFGSRARAEHEIGLAGGTHSAGEDRICAQHGSTLRSSYRAPSAEAAGRYTVDTPVPYRFEDVIAAAESRMGKLENGDLAVQYQRLLMRINAVRQNPALRLHFRRWRPSRTTRWSRFCASCCGSRMTSGRWRSFSWPASRPRRWK